MISWLKRINFIILIFLLVSCFNNADRDNPLDPRSEKYQDYGKLQGHVYTYYAPFQPLSSAKMTLIPGYQSTFTDEYGAFYFNNLAPGNYLITVDYENYAPDSSQVHIISNKTTAIQFNLDGLPRLDSLCLTSGFAHEPFPIEPTRLFDCKAKVCDPDGPADIENVSIIIPIFDFRNTLKLSETVGNYQRGFRESDLTVTNIEELLGHEIFIEITDRAGKICRFGPKFLVRVIDEEPEIESPRGLALVTAQPMLKWNFIRVPFSFTFKLEVYRIINQYYYYDVLTVSNLPSDVIEHQIQTALKPDLYWWTISIVDEWGNWSRSERATFQVGE